jgi:hypothetical protein
MPRPKRDTSLNKSEVVPPTQRTIETSITMEENALNAPISDSQLQCIDKLAADASDNLPSGMPTDAQEALADLVALLPDLKETGNAHLIPIAQVALKGLLSAQPNVLLSKTLVQNLRVSIRNNPASRRMRGKGSILVMTGLGALLYVAIPSMFFFIRGTAHDAKLYGVDVALIFMVGVAGAIGSTVSIMVRVRDFADLVVPDRTIFILVGFVKPIVGTAFALFVFAVLNGGILPVTVATDKAPAFFTALGFIAGFSERFATDIASQTEQVITSSSVTATKKTQLR